MLLAHAPAGYLLTRFLSRTVYKNKVVPERSNPLYRKMMIAGIIGGILPDFDFIYHIFVGSAQTSHHAYWTHMPFFWLIIMGILFLTGEILKKKRFQMVASVLCVSALVHLMLDTLTGVIYWFYPLSSKGLNIFTITDVHVWWVENFMYHWTFLIEITIVTAAGIIFLRVRETALYIAELFRRHEKLREATFRIGVCMFGLLVVTGVGSLRFNIDNRIVNKIILLKQHIVRTAFNF